MEKEQYDIKELRFHNDVIQKFSDDLYDNIFSRENLISKHKAIMLSGDKFYGYFMEKDRTTYFMLSEFLNRLPFKVVEEEQTDYKGEVFNMIYDVKDVHIPARNALSFKELIDITPAFKHTNPIHFTLYKIVAYAARCDRINARISTTAGFGKDSVAGIIQQLVDSTVNIYGATFAKLEYSLTNKLMILNEMGNLKPDEKMSMQEFLLATGAYHNSYTKRTRKTKTTQEQYDISKLSLLIFYNLPEYYIGKAQEYFDQLFTRAVIERFIPFVFEGRLTTKFEQLFDIDKVATLSAQTFKDVIATIHYYRQNQIKTINFEVSDEFTFINKIGEPIKRYERTFNVILKYISAYSRTQEEFDMLSKELYSCYTKYESLLETTKTMM